MSDREEVEVAEAKMNAAKEQLLSCIERGRVRDWDEYRRLVERVKKTERGFMRAVGELER